MKTTLRKTTCCIKWQLNTTKFVWPKQQYCLPYCNWSSRKGHKKSPENKLEKKFFFEFSSYSKYISKIKTKYNTHKHIVLGLLTTKYKIIYQKNYKGKTHYGWGKWLEKNACISCQVSEGLVSFPVFLCSSAGDIAWATECTLLPYCL